MYHQILRSNIIRNVRKSAMRINISTLGRKRLKSSSLFSEQRKTIEFCCIKSSAKLKAVSVLLKIEKLVCISNENICFSTKQEVLKKAAMVVQCPERLIEFKSKAADIRYCWRFL